MVTNDPVVIIGAGPAGLTAAWFLVQEKIPVVLVEKTTRVGGIARTDEYRGYRFDIGGHRFFTKVPWIMAWWQKIMGADFLERPRLSHIFYRNKFFQYPVKPFDVLRQLGGWETGLCFGSYCYAQIWQRPQEITFADYVVNRFGQRLFNHFFKSYTEKVWGLPTTEIRAAWAAQRIKGLSIFGMLATAWRPGKNKFVSLIEKFYYPRLGPGQLWERVRDEVLASGSAELHYEAAPVSLVRANNEITRARIKFKDGEREIPVRAVISSAPLTELIPLVASAFPEKVLAAACQLKYRDFLTVALIIKQPHLFADTWIYVHEPQVAVGRIQNFKNWSPELVPDAATTCVGMEYFLFDTDESWSWPDERWLALAEKELVALGLARAEDIVDGTVVRMPKSYPVYDAEYENALPIVKIALAAITNLYPVGRNGLHKYNNMDHSMVTARLAVENLLGAQHDIWAVNADDLYQEEIADNE